MSRIVDLPPGVNLSIRQFCEETSLDRDTTARKIKKADVKPSGKRGAWPIYRLRDLLASVYATDDDGAFDPDKLRPFERKAHYQAEQEKLQLQVQRGEFAPRIEVEQEQARIMKIMAQFYDTMPDVMERDCGANGHMLAVLERRLDVLREELYCALADPEASDDAEQSVV